MKNGGNGNGTNGKDAEFREWATQVLIRIVDHVDWMKSFVARSEERWKKDEERWQKNDQRLAKMIMALEQHTAELKEIKKRPRAS